VSAARWRRAIAAVALVAMAAAGCSSGDDDADDSDRPSADPSGVVRLGLPGPLVMDPAKASLASPSDLMVLDVLHDGLTRLDGSDGEGIGQGLAVEWAPDAAQQIWRFTLDAEATFASGRPVRSADVVASLERVAAGGDTSLAALRLEVINGFRAFVDGAAPNLAGLRAIDDETVEIALDAPMSVLPVLLASPVYGVVDIASLEAAAAEGGSPGDVDLSGSWEIAEADEDHLLVTRREGVEAELDGIDLRPYADSGAAYAAFTDGDVDWASVPSEQYGAAVEEYGDDAFAPFQAELFFGLNVASPSLANPELRKAIAAAIDRDAIVRAVYPDLADPLVGIVPAGIPSHAPAECTACTHDPERARSILAAAYPGGGIPQVAIDFDQSPAQEAMAAIIAESLQAVGIPAVQRPLPLEDYKRFVVSGGQELFSFGWIGGYPSADAYLDPLFRSGSDDNLTALASPDIDALLAQARSVPYGPDAVDRWSAAEVSILDAAVVIPIAQFRTQVVVADDVDGLDHAVDGSVDWSQVTLESG
jgi:ABC-type transport system substrate-binding protein